ncbi:MAG: hypothetical protein KDA45_14520, partial [Planctomycetales bacterium]|nr:hypothetical protein [Planctomycetales bacterium]
MSWVRTVCLWPGLPAAWYRGRGRGLLLSVVFAWCVSLLLLATFVWPAWLSLGQLRLLWVAAWGTWLVAAGRNYWQLQSLLQCSDSQAAQSLVEAQAEYLRGNWFDAEAILLEVLQRQPRDPEALLLLVGVLRHTKRWQPALRRLGQLELLESARPWLFEIGREKSLIHRAMAAAQLPLTDSAETASQSAAPESAASQNEASQNEASENGDPKNGDPKNGDPKNAVSKNAVSKNAVSGSVASGNSDALAGSPQTSE